MEIISPPFDAPVAAPRAPITIKGVRIDSIKIERSDSTGEQTIESSYSILTSANKVVAKQTVGGYNGMKIQPSPATMQAMAAAVRLYQNDIDATLGFA